MALKEKKQRINMAKQAEGRKLKKQMESEGKQSGIKAGSARATNFDKKCAVMKHRRNLKVVKR